MTAGKEHKLKEIKNGFFIVRHYFYYDSPVSHVFCRVFTDLSCCQKGVRALPSFFHGFGAILVNLPMSAWWIRPSRHWRYPWYYPVAVETGSKPRKPLPLLLFIGIGAMIDFGPLLSNPIMLLFGAAAQFGIFLTISVAVLLGFELSDAASIGIIGAADGPTSILVSQILRSNYIGPLRWRRIPTWLWFLWSSPLLLIWSPQKKNA